MAAKLFLFAGDLLLHQILMPSAHFGSSLQERKKCHSVSEHLVTRIDNFLIFLNMFKAQTP
ncbi:hypothetical protein KC19_3G231400 [Ceratodon purpureus]|uniref:Uncharacterized protein n=1 Tax=Ceratodon purpureus TaxID=3225 RepID=A0A8T0ILU5_CERPU|nr:hypothetical protein KC19_3G231400 [Ceratodon purpureus]